MTKTTDFTCGKNKTSGTALFGSGCSVFSYAPREDAARKEKWTRANLKGFVHPDVRAALVQKVFSSLGIAALFIEGFDSYLCSETKGFSLQGADQLFCFLQQLPAKGTAAEFFANGYPANHVGVFAAVPVHTAGTGGGSAFE